MSDMASAASERVQARAERWSGRIADDEHLVGDLPEEAAFGLVYWGVDAADALAATTADLDDDAAEHVLDAGTAAIKTLLETIGDAVKVHAAEDAAARNERLGQLALVAADPAARSVFVDGNRRTTAALAASLDGAKLLAGNPDGAELCARIITALWPLPASSENES